MNKNLLALLFLLSCSLSSAHAQIQGDYAPDTVLVTYKNAPVFGSSTTVSNIGYVDPRATPWNGVIVHLNSGVTPDQALQYFRSQSDVLYAEHDWYSYGTDVPSPNDNFYSLQWHLPQTRTDAGWASWFPNPTSNVVAVIDSGITATHIDLLGKLNTGYDAYEQNDLTDYLGHGTATSGVIGAKVNSGNYVAGVAGWTGISTTVDTTNVKIIPVKVLDANNRGAWSVITRGVNWAVSNKGSSSMIINLSLGGYTFSNNSEGQWFKDCIKNAWTNGCIVVAAAGNDRTNQVFYPAAYNALDDGNVISVAATNKSDTLIDFFPGQTNYGTNYGSWVVTSAPGLEIYTTTKDGGYGSWQGTSFSAPIVAGEAALLWSQNPSLSKVQVHDLIVQKTDPYNPLTNKSLASGAGRVNIYKALLSSLGKMLGTLDANGDGRGDILWKSDLTQMITLWRTNASSPTATSTKTVLYTPSNPTDFATRWRYVGAADLNGDGRDDLVWQDTTNGNVYYWTINSTYDGLLANGYIYQFSTPSPQWVAVGLGKVNSDSTPDLVLQNSSTGEIYLWTLGWDGTKVTLPTNATLATPSSLDWKLVTLADLNGDGITDLVLQNSSTRQVGGYILTNNNTGVNTTGVLAGSSFTIGTAPSSGWNLRGKAKLNTNDNTDDLIFQNSGTGQIGVWTTTGNTSSMLGTAFVFAAPNDGVSSLTDMVIVGAPTLDGDGKADFVFQQSSTNAPFFWKLTLPAASSTTMGVTQQWMIARP